MNLLTFQIRMKTAEDLKRFITTGFSNKKWLGSAHNITTAQQSIVKTATMVAFIHAGECGNINALQPSIQKLMEKIKSNEEAS